MINKVAPLFEKGGKLEKFYPIFEMIDTFIYSPTDQTTGRTHIRDSLDLKRLMITVAFALLPCLLMACFNTGLQANSALNSADITDIPGWRGSIMSMLHLAADPNNFISNFIHGLLYLLPIYLITNLAGGFWEMLFSIIRKHEINEGLLITGLLFPLILPATIPLWQVALGISFGVVIGKEVFGGTGKNFLNPALTARAFLFFAYPAQISGDQVWIAVDGLSSATPLAKAAESGLANLGVSWQDAFLGFLPGSLGETSTLACILGAIYLIYTGIGSWRIMLSVLLGMSATALLLNMIGSTTNPLLAVTPAWHLVLGGFAFGTVFMATDPVSAAMTNGGKYVYGLLIGFMVVLIRVINPAFPEGMMLAILFGNCFAPLIDYFFVNAVIKRRAQQYV